MSWKIQLEKILGKKFLEKFEKAINETQKLSDEDCLRLCKEAIELFKKTGESVVKLSNGMDAIIAVTPQKPDQMVKKASSGRYKVAMLFTDTRAIEEGVNVRAPFISVFVPTEEDVKTLTSEPGRVFVIIGKFNTRTYQGQITWNMNARCYKTLDEIEVEAEAVEEEEKVEEEMKEIEVESYIEELLKVGAIAVPEEEIRRKVIEELNRRGVKYEVKGPVIKIVKE